MNESKYIAIKVKCFNCKKSFNVKINKEEEIKEGEKPKSHCPYCKEENTINIPDNPEIDPIYRY